MDSRVAFAVVLALGVLVVLAVFGPYIMEMLKTLVPGFTIPDIGLW